MEQMTDTTIAFIGLGLIGGSIARGIKRARPDIHIMAYMRTRSKLEQARQDGIVDEILDGVDSRLSRCDLIFLCTPVEYNAQYLATIRPFLKQGALITDVGSTKTKIHEEILSLGLEDCFVGGHPMAGSEKTGYENSTDHLLENAYYIITPARGLAPEGEASGASSSAAESPSPNVQRIVRVAETIGAIPIVLDYREHDRITAAISHVPHLIASGLVGLVRDNDSPQGLMKLLAAGGFKDITRIASSSPEMWSQICMTNAHPIADMLERYIASLSQILADVKEGREDSIYRFFDASRSYRNSITDRAKGSLEPAYEFSVDIVDEPGSISTLSVILAAKGISIKNIGINNNRELGEGALKISFYDKDSMEAARRQLEKYKYELSPR